MKEITREQYYSKREELIEKFNKEFLHQWHTDATFRAVLEMLIWDENPYSIIERLIEQRKEMLDKMTEILAKTPVPHIILPR